MKVAIYPGSFDPITFGHIDIVERAASLFDQVVIGVAESKSKNPLFSTDERLDLINEVFSGNSKIRAIGYSKKLTVDLARENNAIAIIRGLRAVAAAVGLAGIGANKTQLEIWADPNLERNTHKVEVKSDSAEFEMSIQNVQTPENPGTGRITGLSVIACLRGLKSSLKVGS